MNNIDLTSIFKTVVWDNYLKFGIISGLSALGLSSTGPIGIILSIIITKSADWFYKNIVAPNVKIGSIILSDELHQSLWKNSVSKLDIIAKESGIDSKAFRDAHQNEKDKFTKAVFFNINPLTISM